jgi:hypothetical protein
LELDVVTQQFGDYLLIDFKYAYVVAGLGGALRVGFEGEIEGVEYGADAAHEVEVLELFLD